MALAQVERHRTGGGRSIYRIQLEVFPGFGGNVYVITGGDRPVLVDCGSGQESSNRDLEVGIGLLEDRFGEALALEDLGAIVVTHGHIDHFGGLAYLRRRTAAPVGAHLLDRRVLSHYEERLAVASNQVAAFLETTGVAASRCQQYMAMYLSMKSLFRSQEVHFSFEEGPLLGGELEAIHVPGHCPGQVCLLVDDVLLAGDHLLAKISPHISPEAITAHTGFTHYYQSLDRIAGVGGVRLGLAGHQGPIDDPAARAREIRKLHEERQEQIVELCRQPRRIVELSRQVFGPVRSYHTLLALLETGAHVEYLYQRGELVAANVEEIESDRNAPIVYRRA